MEARDKFVEKWATHLSGKFSRFAFCQTSGPGLDSRVRDMLRDLEKAIGQMFDEVAKLEPPKPPANIPPGAPTRKATP